MFERIYIIFIFFCFMALISCGTQNTIHDIPQDDFVIEDIISDEVFEETSQKFDDNVDEYFTPDENNLNSNEPNRGTNIGNPVKQDPNPRPIDIGEDDPCEGLVADSEDELQSDHSHKMDQIEDEFDC